MLKLGRFLPQPFSTVNKNIPTRFSLKSIQNNYNGYIITFKVPSTSQSNKFYDSQIFIETDNSINPNKNVKFNCTCESFLFQYSAILNKYNALIEPTSINKLPKKNQKIFICKHLVSCVRFIHMMGTITQLKQKIEVLK